MPLPRMIIVRKQKLYFKIFNNSNWEFFSSLKHMIKQPDKKAYETYNAP
jgi:hypothetical protein